MLAPFARERLVRPFELEGVNIFTGNELDPTDEPDAALFLAGMARCIDISAHWR